MLFLRLAALIVSFFSFQILWPMNAVKELSSQKSQSNNDFTITFLSKPLHLTLKHVLKHISSFTLSKPQLSSQKKAANVITPYLTIHGFHFYGDRVFETENYENGFLIKLVGSPMWIYTEDNHQDYHVGALFYGGHYCGVKTFFPSNSTQKQLEDLIYQTVRAESEIVNSQTVSVMKKEYTLSWPIKHAAVDLEMVIAGRPYEAQMFIKTLYPVIKKRTIECDVNIKAKIELLQNATMNKSLREAESRKSAVDVSAAHHGGTNDVTNQQLFQAIQNRDGAKMLDLLVAGANPNCVDAKDKTPLMYAAESGQLDCVVQLLEHGASREALDKTQETQKDTVLHSAIRSGNELILTLLFEDSMLNTKNNAGETPLMHAVQRRNVGQVEALLYFGAQTAIKDIYGRNALMRACNELPCKINARADANASKQEAERQMQALARIISLLVQWTEDLDDVDNAGSTALMLAIEKNNQLAVEALLRAHADVHVARKKDTALTIATKLGCKEIIKNLETYKAAYEAWFRENGVLGKDCHLIYAASEGDVEYARRFLAQRSSALHDKLLIDCNERAKNGETALYFAVITRNVAMVEFLLHEGADPLMEYEGQTIMSIAQTLKEEAPDVYRLIFEAAEKRLAPERQREQERIRQETEHINQCKKLFAQEMQAIVADIRTNRAQNEHYKSERTLSDALFEKLTQSINHVQNVNRILNDKNNLTPLLCVIRERAYGVVRQLLSILSVDTQAVTSDNEDAFILALKNYDSDMICLLAQAQRARVINEPSAQRAAQAAALGSALSDAALGATTDYVFANTYIGRFIIKCIDRISEADADNSHVQRVISILKCLSHVRSSCFLSIAKASVVEPPSRHAQRLIEEDILSLTHDADALRSLFLAAIRAGNQEFVKFMMEADRQFVTVEDDNGTSPLMVAAQADRVDMVSLLLAHGADIDHADMQRKTVFDCTLTKACQTLLREEKQKKDLNKTKQANKERRDKEDEELQRKGWSELKRAIHFGDCAAIERYTCDDESRLAKEAFEAAIYAIKEGKISEYEALCKREPIIVAITDDNGYTLLMHAIDSEQYVLANLLLNSAAVLPVAKNRYHALSLLESKKHHKSENHERIQCKKRIMQKRILELEQLSNSLLIWDNEHYAKLGAGAHRKLNGSFVAFMHFCSQFSRQQNAEDPGERMLRHLQCDLPLHDANVSAMKIEQDTFFMELKAIMQSLLENERVALFCAFARANRIDLLEFLDVLTPVNTSFSFDFLKFALENHLSDVISFLTGKAEVIGWRVLVLCLDESLEQAYEIVKTKQIAFDNDACKQHILKLILARYMVNPTALMQSLFYMYIDRFIDVNAVDLSEKQDLDLGGVGKGVSLLMILCSGGESEGVRKVLAKGADVNKKTEKGVTALNYASLCENKETCTQTYEILLKAGADPNVMNQYGETPLIVEAKKGNYEAVYLLLIHGADINKRGSNNNTALIVACDAGHSDIVEFLLHRGADRSIEGNDKQTAAIQAIWSKRIDIVRLFLRRQRSTSIEWLRHACTVPNNEEIINFILDNRPVNLNSRRSDYPDEFIQRPIDTDGNTCLHQATRFHVLTNMSALLDQNADINATNRKGETPLLFLIKNSLYQPIENVVPAVELLLTENADPSIADQDGNTPLHYAAQYASDHLVVKLIQARADAGAKNKKGETPLAIAINAQQRNIGSIIQLFARDPEPCVELLEEEDYSGDNPVRAMKFSLKHLMFAEIIRLQEWPLLEKFVRTVRDALRLSFLDTKMSPLMVLCQKGNSVAAQKLIELGADIHATDEVHCTALHYACESNNPDMVRFLLERGAREDVLTVFRANPLLYFIICLGSTDNTILNERLACTSDDIRTGKPQRIAPLLGERRQKALENVLAIIRLLLHTNTINPRVQNEHGYGAVHIAVTLDLPIMKLLLTVIDVNERTGDGLTPLMLACDLEPFEQAGAMTSLLLEYASINVNAINQNGMNALCYACKNKYSEIVRLLLNRIDIDLNMAHDLVRDEHSQRRCNPLEYAAQHESVDCCMLLLNDARTKISRDSESCCRAALLALAHSRKRNGAQWRPVVEKFKQFGIDPTKIKK